MAECNNDSLYPLEQYAHEASAERSAASWNSPETKHAVNRAQLPQYRSGLARQRLLRGGT